MPIETIIEPITGKETPDEPASPLAALVLFYRAFNNSDLSLMTSNWSQSSVIAMDNPLGGIKRGWEEIGSVYERIFSGPAKVYVEFYDYTVTEAETLFFTVGRERGAFTKGDISIDLAIRTSRIFRKEDGVWRQVHHHGSIDDADLLKRYQAAVSG